MVTAIASVDLVDWGFTLVLSINRRPFWLSPRQIAIVPVSKDALSYCSGVKKQVSTVLGPRCSHSIHRPVSARFVNWPLTCTRCVSQAWFSNSRFPSILSLQLHDAGFQVFLDASTKTMNKKIRECQVGSVQIRVALL